MILESYNKIKIVDKDIKSVSYLGFTRLHNTVRETYSYMTTARVACVLIIIIVSIYMQMNIYLRAYICLTSYQPLHYVRRRDVKHCWILLALYLLIDYVCHFNYIVCCFYFQIQF